MEQYRKAPNPSKAFNWVEYLIDKEVEKLQLKSSLPKWLTRNVKDDYDGSRYSSYTLPLLDRHPLDHFEKRIVKDRENPDKKKTIYISQPYGLSYGWIKHMVEVCEKHGIEFDIRGDSDHYPRHTMMVEWSQK